MSSHKCDICFEIKSESSFGYLPCSHSFCTECIGQLRQDVCPLCRNPFNEYSQSSYASSAPTPSYIPIINEPDTSRDDMFIVHEELINRRINNRHRRRRRRRRLNTNRRRRRSENLNEEIFEIEIETEQETQKENTDNDRNKNTRNERGDNWQQLNLQRSRYSI